MIDIIALSNGHVKITDNVKNTVQYFQNSFYTVDFNENTQEIYIYKIDKNNIFIRFLSSDVSTPISPGFPLAWDAEDLSDELNSFPYFY